MPDQTPDAGDNGASSHRPPGFLEAMRTSFRPARRPSSRARPATGTDADAKAINYLDRREQRIGMFLGAFQIVIGVVSFVRARSVIVHASKTISQVQAHRDTISYHQAAPYLLAINLVLGLAIEGAVLTKRRSLVGFTILIGGLSINASGGGSLIGLIYLGVGMWLVFRSLKRNPSARAARANPGPGAPGRGAARGQRASGQTQEADRRALAAGARATAEAVRKPPPASKRYTPPAPRRPAPPKLPDKSEPEKQSRFTSWLRR
ncbi:MAG: hypothetical protein ACYDGN_09965 [Acidimicrobiales bacterium]